MSQTASPVPIAKTVLDIADLCRLQADFWPKARGWAPDEAADVLEVSRIDRVASLAQSLGRWISDENLSDGDLILAWTNLGAVLEGSLKLFLCVFLCDYQRNQSTRRTQAFHAKKQLLKDPDGLTLSIILQVFEKSEILSETHITIVKRIIPFRNSIHAFKQRDIGTLAEFNRCLRDFREIQMALDARLPYPDQQ